MNNSQPTANMGTFCGRSLSPGGGDDSNGRFGGSNFGGNLEARRNFTFIASRHRKAPKNIYLPMSKSIPEFFPKAMNLDAMDLSAFRAKKKDQLLGETQKPNMQNPLFLRKRSPCCQVPHVEGKAQNVERSRQLYLADHFGQRLLCKYRYIDVYMYVCILYM